MTVMTDGIKCNKNRYLHMSFLSLALAAVGQGFTQCVLVQKRPSGKQRVSGVWNQVRLLCSCSPVSRNDRRCAAEWDRCGADLGFHRSCCWNTETSHSRRPLNSPGSSGSQLRETQRRWRHRNHTCCLQYKHYSDIIRQDGLSAPVLQKEKLIISSR